MEQRESNYSSIHSFFFFQLVRVVYLARGETFLFFVDSCGSFETENFFYTAFLFTSFTFPLHRLLVTYLIIRGGSIKMKGQFTKRQNDECKYGAAEETGNEQTSDIAYYAIVLPTKRL